MNESRYVWFFGMVALGLAHCSSSSDAVSHDVQPDTGVADATPDADGTRDGSPSPVVDAMPGLDGADDAGDSGGRVCTPPKRATIPPSAVPPEHRAQAKTCNPTSSPLLPDGGGATCSTDSDCAGDGSSTFPHCLAGRCAFDACLTDADCANHGVCVCSTDYYGGNAAYHPNVCVPSDCHTDSDCGSSGYCSPSHTYCGSFTGYYCHKSADTCVDPAVDCGSCDGNACVYAPTVGHFACGFNTCNG